MHNFDGTVPALCPWCNSGVWCQVFCSCFANTSVQMSEQKIWKTVHNVWGLWSKYNEENYCKNRSKCFKLGKSKWMLRPGQNWFTNEMKEVFHIAHWTGIYESVGRIDHSFPNIFNIIENTWIFLDCIKDGYQNDVHWFKNNMSPKIYQKRKKNVQLPVMTFHQDNTPLLHAALTMTPFIF